MSMHPMVKNILIKGKSKLQKKIDKIKSELNATPHDKYFQVQKEFAELLEKNKGDKRLTKDFNQELRKLSERDKVARKEIERTEKLDRCKLISDYFASTKITI